MAKHPNRDEVEALYDEGVAAVRSAASNLLPLEWETPVCGVWTATETVRHLVGVAEWYHAWLDRAIDGELSRPFAGEDIDHHTAAALSAHDDLDGDRAVAAFCELAAAYLERARHDWDRPFSYPFGTVTVGLHAGVAATEWHLHAWDLSSLSAVRHVPSAPRDLFVAAGMCVAAAESGAKGAVISRIVPLAAQRDPWETMLRRSGRS